MTLTILFIITSCENKITDYSTTPCENITCSNQGFCTVKDKTEAICACNENYHAEGLECINNTKMIDCIDVSPNNANTLNIKTEITWKDGSWSQASDCEWECKEGYTQENETCIEQTNKPTIIRQPTDVTTDLGNSVSFVVEAR